MTKYFINHPIPAIVFSIILTLLGILAAINLPISEYPDIAPPSVMVSTSYLGADASVVNETVAQVIEPEITGLDGFEYMTSTITTAGNYDLTIYFELGTDVNNAAVQVQNKIVSVSSDLPGAVQENGVNVSKNVPAMSLMVALNSPRGTYDGLFLSNYAAIYFMDKIKRVDGVGMVATFGESDYSMRVWLNPDKAADLNLSVEEIISAIQEQNVRPAVGSIGKLPIQNSQEKEFIGRAENQKQTPEDFEKIVVKNDGGSLVRLKDVANISLGSRESKTVAQQYGKDASIFIVYLTNTANTLETLGEIKQILAESKKNFPPDMDYSIIVDATLFVQESLEEVTKTFVEAFVLVILVVLIFLQNFRTTIISLLAIPVSLVATFIFFPPFSFTINTLTLFAMILAIGLVVDDAIVVIEIVEKKIDDGLDVKTATLESMQEVQKPIIAIACVLAAVFLPVVFLDGITGELYKQFALTIVISMALSAIVALSLTPALCVLILRPREKKLSAFDKFFAKVQAAYKNLLEILMRRKFISVFVLIIFVTAAIFFSKVLPSVFIPEEDKGYFYVAVTLPEGTSLNRTVEIMDRFCAEIKKIDAVENSVINAGYDLFSGGGAKSNAGTIFANLKHWDDRDESAFDILDEISEIAEEKFSELDVFPMSADVLPGIESVGGISAKILDIGNHTNEELAEFAQKIRIAAEEREELEDIEIGFNISTPYIDFKVDEDKAKLLGVNLENVYTALRVNFGGDEVNDFSAFGRNYKVVLQADKNFRSAADSMKFIFVKNSASVNVPLDSLISFKISSGPSIITRFNGVQSISVDGNISEGFSSSEGMDALEEVIEEVAPNTFQLEWDGISRQQKNAESSVVEILMMSLVFVFLCLVALYESWRLPFVILLSVPIGICGALLAEIFSGNPGSVYMQIGILVLIGLAAKNAILIVEFAKEEVARGKSPEAAAILAAVMRLRPILMTSLAFIVACLPLAFAVGAGSVARNGMGTAVVGGMFFATFFGIFIVPILFAIIGKKGE